MKRTAAVLLALAMLLALVSCAQEKNRNDQGEDTQTEEPGDAQQGEQQDSGQEDSQDGDSQGEDSRDQDSTSAEPLVEIDYAGEDLLAQKDAYDAYTEEGAEDSEFLVKVLFTAKDTVKNFKVLRINAAAEEGVRVEGELYAQEEVTPQRPFVLGMVFAGDVPNMGISYEDGQGTPHSYAIGMSGKDSSLLLIAF